METTRRHTVRLAGLGTAVLVGALAFGASAYAADQISVGDATIVVRDGKLPSPEQSAAVVLTEEIRKRTGFSLNTSSEWPKHGPVIAITSKPSVPGWHRAVPVRQGANLAETRTDGYRLFVDATGGSPVVWIIGADPRATLYGAGALLRNLDWARGRAMLPAKLDIATAPEYPIRGHQLGYRATANSWDAWDAGQFDQYIRELAFFGINAVEGIPFHDERLPSVMKVPRREMNRKQSEICARYGLEYWVWTPADFDLKDQKKRDAMLALHEELYKDCPELTGVFFPGGDPGDNPPELVLPFLADVSKLLKATHPKARIWLSLQGFNKEQTEYALNYLEKNNLDWLGGLCEGPSSPPIAYLRNRLPKQYGLRMYPDITHNKLSQYPVPWWDQAFALTLGREAINPRPVQYAYIHNWFAPYCNGFISYSDGVHDDVNKTIWSAMSWDTRTKVRDVLVEYARVFLSAREAENAADGMLALEKNWRGPLVDNGGVANTLAQWQGIEKADPDVASSWRGQMCLVRAYYDAFVRERLLHESRLEDEANAILAQAPARSAATVMTEATAVLNRPNPDPAVAKLRDRVINLYDKLWKSICLESSVDKYFASGGERGASLDYIDVPLNNRWWLEDEFKKVAGLGSEAEKVNRLLQIATWEHPGPGSYYDDIGNTAKSPHVQRSEIYFTNPAENALMEPTFWWLDDGKCRQRLSWQTTLDWPDAVVYEGLNPEAHYIIRSTGYGQALMKINGTRVTPTLDGKAVGEFKEFPVPQECLKDRKLVLTWDRPADEAKLGWRQQSRIAEIWLLKQEKK